MLHRNCAQSMMVSMQASIFWFHAARRQQDGIAQSRMLSLIETWKNPKTTNLERSLLGMAEINNDDPDTFRMMISTDNHLGFAEKDAVRGDDSFAAFEEMLYLARKFHCDTVLVRSKCCMHSTPHLYSWEEICFMRIGRVVGVCIVPWRFYGNTRWDRIQCGCNPSREPLTFKIQTMLFIFQSFPFMAITMIQVEIKVPRISWPHSVREK